MVEDAVVQVLRLPAQALGQRDQLLRAPEIKLYNYSIITYYLLVALGQQPQLLRAPARAASAAMREDRADADVGP